MFSFFKKKAVQPWEQDNYLPYLDASLKFTRHGQPDNWRPYPSMIGMVKGTMGLLDARVIFTGDARAPVTPGPWTGLVANGRFQSFTSMTIPGVYKVEGGE